MKQKYTQRKRVNYPQTVFFRGPRGHEPKPVRATAGADDTPHLGADGHAAGEAPPLLRRRPAFRQVVPSGALGKGALPSGPHGGRSLAAAPCSAPCTPPAAAVLNPGCEPEACWERSDNTDGWASPPPRGGLPWDSKVRPRLGATSGAGPGPHVRLLDPFLVHYHWP